MFQNLNDISDLTFTIVTSFEDIIEMGEDNQPPLIGSCLEEFAEVCKCDRAHGVWRTLYTYFFFFWHFN